MIFLSSFFLQGSIEVTWQIERVNVRTTSNKKPIYNKSCQSSHKRGFLASWRAISITSAQQLNLGFFRWRKLAFHSGGFCVIRPINDTSLVLTQAWSSARDNFSCFKGNIVNNRFFLLFRNSLNHSSVAFDVEIMNRLVDFSLCRARSYNGNNIHSQLKLRAVD